jgi:hypothetical protein
MFSDFGQMKLVQHLHVIRNGIVCEKRNEIQLPAWVIFLGTLTPREY